MSLHPSRLLRRLAVEARLSSFAMSGAPDPLLSSNRTTGSSPRRTARAQLKHAVVPPCRVWLESQTTAQICACDFPHDLCKRFALCGGRCPLGDECPHKHAELPTGAGAAQNSLTDTSAGETTTDTDDDDEDEDEDDFEDERVLRSRKHGGADNTDSDKDGKRAAAAASKKAKAEAATLRARRAALAAIKAAGSLILMLIPMFLTIKI